MGKALKPYGDGQVTESNFAREKWQNLTHLSNPKASISAYFDLDRTLHASSHVVTLPIKPSKPSKILPI